LKDSAERLRQGRAPHRHGGQLKPSDFEVRSKAKNKANNKNKNYTTNTKKTIL